VIYINDFRPPATRKWSLSDLSWGVWWSVSWVFVGRFQWRLLRYDHRTHSINFQLFDIFPSTGNIFLKV
jgi:hypothetical protein